MEIQTRDGGKRAGQDNVEGSDTNTYPACMMRKLSLFALKKTYKTPGWWWLISLMPAHRRQRQAI